MVMKVLKGERCENSEVPKRELDNEAKALLQLELAGVHGIVRMKHFTYNLARGGNNNAIFMADAGT